MKRRVGLLTFVIAVALAVPAVAQVKSRDHRKKRKGDRKEEVVKSRRGKKGTAPVKVTSWSPKSGPVGEMIRIDGTGFTRKTVLLVGGKRLRPKRVARDHIEFVWPRRWGDGSIVLRHPNMARDLTVGSYEVIENPVIVKFAPKSGIGGTRVEIKGSGFRKGDQVLMNNRAVKVNQLGPKRIVATIPRNATTDYLVVSRPGGTQARSRAQFKVVQPAPQVSGMSPGGAPAGSTVRITGQYFTNADKILYGRFPMSVAGSSATWVDVIIPEARNDQYITIKNRWGSSRTRDRFRLERPAAISRFSPKYGVVGQRVDIYGANFQAGDVVRLGGRQLKILQLRSSQISVEIPNGAQTGKFAIQRNRVRIHSKKAFEVVYMPSVSGFSPSGGAVGTRVTITGSHFSPDAKVYFGRQQLRILQRSDAALVVAIPNRAKDQFFAVRTKGGESSTESRFQVHYYSAVTGVRPSAATVGSRVVIRGKALRRADQFYLGNVELPVVEWKPRRVVVTIPKGAVSGNIAWDTYGQMNESRVHFTVLQPPSITRYGPHAGPAGTRITITGDNFTRKTKVLYGNREIKVVRQVLPTSLDAIIPNNARGTKYIWVVDAGARIRSGKPFQVIVPPAISSFSPTYGTPGTEVTIAGTNFSKASKIRLGRAWLPVIRSTATNVTVQIPRNAKHGKDYFWVEEGNMVERANKPFVVTGWSTITGFKPGKAKPGQRIVISGSNFSANTRIQFGKYECEVVKVGPRGRRIHVILTESATGKGYLWAVDGENRSQSPAQLEVKGAENDRRRERVPSRRGKKKKKKRTR